MINKSVKYVSNGRPIPLEKLEIKDIEAVPKGLGYSVNAEFRFYDEQFLESGCENDIYLMNETIEGLFDDVKKFGYFLQETDLSKRNRLFSLLWNLYYSFNSEDTFFEENIISILPEITFNEEIVREDEIDCFIARKILKEIDLSEDKIDFLINHLGILFKDIYNIDATLEKFGLLVYSFNKGWSYFRVNEKFRKRIAKES